MTRVTAVIVAYNREELLRETLAGLAAQRRAVDEIIVVDNASSDQSASVVREVAPEARLISLTENTGGAGGFAVGMAAALGSTAAEDPDWVWVMDDDTVPG
ncbi:glycosyltransferase, partial [Leucobacter sp. M11]|uniref:glycosyltransferase n=1 Tax=Leucobacter sp. M11 TaxID=2993565 RepID=UPI002D800D8D